MSRRSAVTARDWHRALLGLTGERLTVERQAYRLSADHSDEVVVLRHGSDVCVAARFGDVTRVWSCHDRVAADEMFDARTDPRDGWTEATTRSDEPAA